MAQNTGIGRYVRNLINALLRAPDGPSLLVITNPPGRDPTGVWDWLEVAPEQRGRVEVVSFQKPVPIYSLREQAWLPRVLEAKRVDLFHAPHFNLPLLVAGRPTPLVVTLHDTTYLKWPPSWVGGRYARFMMTQAARRASAIITATEASAAELSEALDLDPSRIHVIGHGADEMAGWLGNLRRGDCSVISPRVRRLSRFVLSVGTNMPHKNQVVLVRALARLSELGFGDLRLVLVGARHRGTAAIESEALRCGVADRVVNLGAVPDRDLAYLYDNAIAMLHPSLSEGFGLPLVESFVAGCPVVCSDIPVLREVGGQAPLYCAASDADGFAAAVGRLLLNSAVAERATRSGVERARAFSFARAADQTAEVYRAVLDATG